jgi:membrane-associated phospholipid phosphatase
MTAPTKRLLTIQLALGLVIVAAVAAFAVIAEDILSGGDVEAADLVIVGAVHNTTSPGWERFFHIVTWFGSREMLFAGASIVAVVVFVKYGVLLAAGWVVSQLGGALLNLTLKQSFARARPEHADALLAATSWSFPSAHAMNTFVLVGLGAYLLVRGVRSGAAATLAVALAVVWCLLVGFSRIYLGVHFASDVVAGLLAGAAWVAICISVMETLRWRAHHRTP